MIRCSFCFKSEDQVSKMISSPGEGAKSYICDECIRSCAFLLERVGVDGPIGHPIALPSKEGSD
jgi:ATP-dependent protease Clp ATPase subunit